MEAVSSAEMEGVIPSILHFCKDVGSREAFMRDDESRRGEPSNEDRPAIEEETWTGGCWIVAGSSTMAEMRLRKSVGMVEMGRDKWRLCKSVDMAWRFSG